MSASSSGAPSAKRTCTVALEAGGIALEPELDPPHAAIARVQLKATPA
jgi:hypothetical protein